MEAEKKRHSDRVKQEAQLLMDELFLDFQDLGDGRASHASDVHALDVDWIDGRLEASSTPISHRDRLSPLQRWGLVPPKKTNYESPEHWIPRAEKNGFYPQMLLVLGGLTIVTPMAFLGNHWLQKTAQSRSVVAATAIQTSPQASDSDKAFADYADKALKQIQAQPQQTASAASITTLPTLQIGQIPSALPPVAISPTTQPSVLPTPPNAETNVATPTASPEDLKRLALRVVEPQSIPSSTTPPATTTSTSSQPIPQQKNKPANISSIRPAPNTSLPQISSGMSEPKTIAAATPMNTPTNASRKVIGIVELGLQSTLMVSNNGSHINFQVGDTVNEQGWKLVDIANGKAVLQKGSEYKTLSEGQYF